MDVSIELVKFYVGLANMCISLYLVWVICSSLCHKSRSFSRTMGVMLVAAVLFFVLQAVEAFRLFPEPVLDATWPIAVMMLLLLLVSAALEIRRGMLAHDLLVRRRVKGRLSDVE